MRFESVTPKATLLGYSQPINGGHPEGLIVAAAKLCYGYSDAEALLEKMDDEKRGDFIRNLKSKGHETPFEQLTINFSISNISRACSHQLVRHRIASFNQQSQRYVDLSKGKKGEEAVFKYVAPAKIRNNDKTLAIYQQKVEEEYNNYVELIETLTKTYLSELPDDKELSPALAKIINSQCIEDARYLLPNACATQLICQMNARALMNFFNLRCCNRAQEEIRELADQMLDIAQDVAPNVFFDAGAPCVSGPCPEGTMTCGTPHQKIKIFSAKGR